MQPPISIVASAFGMTNRRNTSFMAISIFDLPEAFEPYRMPNLYKNTPSATSVTSSEDGPLPTKLNSCLSRMERKFFTQKSRIISKYFVYYCNFATIIQIIFDKESIFVFNIRNNNTFLHIFNYKIDIEIAN